MSEDTIKLVITRKGLEECISAKAKGIQLSLKWVSAGDRAYTPNPNQTTLQNELQRVEFSEFKDIGGSQIQAVAKFSGPDEYPIRELGFWLEDGTLFGVISAPNTTLNYKARNGHCIQPFTLDLSALPSDTVTVVVGTENLNILIDTEMMMDAVAFLHSQVIQIKQGHTYMNMSERLRILEANHG
ncbi:phage tail protein [Vibrio rhizosphaerae]|uniref:phage tail protein n=1 Tax=Vibrio rhizosphaerae TaxID=398736 RepID=UPI00068A690E|nr:phage tail protein [Vibrio rhizosphaerae]